MPRDPNGVYTLPPSYFVQTGDTILPNQHNPPMEDMANALTNSIDRDGRTVMTGHLQMGGNKVTNAAPGSLDGDVATLKQVGQKASFKTVQDLLADTSMSYSAGTLRVETGDIITAQGFRYEVAASDAADAHVDTAGGLKLYVEPLLDGRMPAAAFGVVGDNTTDNYQALMAALRAGQNKILLPPGNIRHSYPLYGDSLDIVGAGYERSTAVDRVGSTLIKTTNNLPDVDLGTIDVNGVAHTYNVDAVIINMAYYNLHLDGVTLLRLSSTDRVQHGIYSPYIAWASIGKVKIGVDSEATNFVNGWTCYFGWKIQIDDLFISADQVGMNFPSNAADTGYNTIVTRALWVKFTKDAGVRIKGCTGLDLGSAYIEDSFGRGLDIDNCPEFTMSGVHLENIGLNNASDALMRIRRSSGSIHGLEFLQYNSNGAAEQIRDLFRLEAETVVHIVGLRDGGALVTDTFAGRYRYFGGYDIDGTYFPIANIIAGGRLPGGVIPQFVYKQVENSNVEVRHLGNRGMVVGGRNFYCEYRGSLNAASLSTKRKLFRLRKPDSGTCLASFTVEMTYNSATSSGDQLDANLKFHLKIVWTPTTCSVTRQVIRNNVNPSGSVTMNFGYASNGDFFEIDVADATKDFSGAFIETRGYSRDMSTVSKILPI